MIKVYTLDTPDPRIKEFAEGIFNLPKGAYNLITRNREHAEILDPLYALGVCQIIHDGTADEIQCMDGYLYAQAAAFDQKVGPEAMLIIKRS